MEQKKKPTNAQLQKRIERAIVHVDRTKETKEIYFSDRGLRLVVNETSAVIQTNFHKHVFSRWTMDGESHPYRLTSLIISYAYDNDCISMNEKGERFYSYAKLLETLKEDENTNLEYLLVYYYSMWLYNIFKPLYMIGDTEQSTFMTYINYVFCIANDAIVLEEHTEDVTNKQFVERLCDNIKKFTADITEQTIFHKMTDDEFAQKELDAMQEMEHGEILENQLRKNQKDESKD